MSNKNNCYDAASSLDSVSVCILHGHTIRNNLLGGNMLHYNKSNEISYSDQVFFKAVIPFQKILKNSFEMFLYTNKSILPCCWKCLLPAKLKCLKSKWSWCYKIQTVFF